MKKLVLQILFPAGPSAPSAGYILLALRLIIGILMLVHGCQKIADYDTLSTTFPDAIGLGSKLSLNLAIFAEVGCSLAVIFGFMFRLALIPLIVTMCVASFAVMGTAPWSAQELPVIYLLIYLLLIAAGPGRYSLDTLLQPRPRWRMQRPQHM